MEKRKAGNTWPDVFWSLFILAVAALVLALGATLAHAQQAPITTPQLNTDFYVAAVSGFYPSIQNAVTLRCAAAGLGSRVIVQAGSPADGTTGFTISAVTGGCAQVPIIDLRATPPGFYKWITSAYVLQGAAPAGTAGGDLSGTYPNPAVSKVNGAAVPASSNVLASDANGKLVNATKQGNGTAVQMAAGAAHLVNDLAIYDAGGNIVDSTVLFSSVPLLGAANTFTNTNNFSSEADVASAPTTGLFMTPSLLSGKLTGTTFFSLAPQTGVTRFGSAAGSNFAINPAGNVAGSNASAVLQWSISNVNGSAQFGAAGAGTAIILNAGGGAISGQNAGVGQWQISSIDGSAAFKSLGGLATIGNSTGLQIAKVAGCAITAGTVVGSGCNLSMPLSPIQSDTLYNVSGCTFTEGAGTNGPLIVGSVFGKTTSNFTISLLASSTTTVNPAGIGTMACFVSHN